MNNGERRLGSTIRCNVTQTKLTLKTSPSWSQWGSGKKARRDETKREHETLFYDTHTKNGTLGETMENYCTLDAVISDAISMDLTSCKDKVLWRS
jgi:hypothetical protein